MPPREVRTPRPMAPRSLPALPWSARLVIVLWVALLLLAAPDSNWFWGVNGLRSVPLGERVLLIALALGSAWVAGSARSRALRWTVAVASAVAIAFPLRERIHFLGDTGVRIGALGMFTGHGDPKPLTAWAQQIHASPLDFATGFLLPAWISSLGIPIESAVSVVSALLALAFFAGAWRTLARLDAPAEARTGLWAALVMAGTLGVFAGYAESAGILLAGAAWWWSELLAPLDRPRRAVRLAAAWLLLFLCHRLALVMLLPQLLRSFGPALAGDRPGPRRLSLALSALAAAIALGSLALAGGPHQLDADLRDLVAAMRDPEVLRSLPSDLLNLLLLMAPLAVLAPAFAGRGALATLVRRPASTLVLAAALPLLPLAVLIPIAPSGLGVHRDWDLATLLAWTLTLGAVMLLTCVAGARLQRALTWLLPALVLGAGGWLAVNADEAAALRRAEALASRPPALAPSQRSQVFLYLSRWAMFQRRPREAARYYEQSYDLVPTPNRGLLGAFAHAQAGDFPTARNLIARVRARGGLDSVMIARADTLEQQILRATGATAPPVAPTGR